jgi:copper/silver efflux system protein
MDTTNSTPQSTQTPSPARPGETLIERLIGASSRNAFLVIVLIVFGIAGGIWALTRVPLDAIPDLSDVQVIITTDWEGRSPDLVEDQITYPISTRFIAAPKVKFVRGESMFGKSFVYVIFEDGTDIYWARSRVIEYLSAVRGMLPEGVNPVIGPDATGVGWVFEYALVDKSGKNSLADLRTFQDWNLRYALESVEGVAEVAPVGGFVKQYQVDLDPNKLVAYGIPLSDVVAKIRMSNADVGGKLFEVGSTEYFVRGRGYVKKIEDIEDIPLKVVGGTPVYVKNVGNVHLGPDIRRGIAELDGSGEVVGGIVVMRYGENALRVIDGIKKKIEEVKSSFPEGVELVPTYDRSGLIKRSIATLREKLIEESIIVALVCIVFLWHVRSALVAIITLPIAIILSFLPMFGLDLTSNIMSLGGIAIAIGAMVDSAIIMIENAHKYLEHFREEKGRDPTNAERIEVIVKAAKSVGRPLFFALLVITVSFMPVSPARVHENVRHVLRGIAWRDARSGADADVDSRQNCPGSSQSGEPLPDLVVSAVRPFRAAVSLAHDPAGAGHPRRNRVSVQATRQRVHAAAERGRHSLHADRSSRHFDQRGGEGSPGAGSDVARIPGSRACVRQSWLG